MVDVVVVNAVEAEQITGIVVETIEQAELAATALRDGGPSAVVTAGALGFAWASLGGDSGASKARAVKHPKSHGAGDVFTAALASALVAGEGLENSSLLAGEAAWKHVSGVGEDS